MIKFRYTARDKSGHEINGIIEAESREKAIEGIRSQGLAPNQIREVRFSPQISKGWIVFAVWIIVMIWVFTTIFGKIL